MKFKGPIEALYDARRPAEQDLSKEEKLDNISEELFLFTEGNTLILQKGGEAAADAIGDVIDDVFNSYFLLIAEVGIAAVLGIIVLEKLF